MNTGVRFSMEQAIPSMLFPPTAMMKALDFKT